MPKSQYKIRVAAAAVGIIAFFAGWHGSFHTGYSGARESGGMLQAESENMTMADDAVVPAHEASLVETALNLIPSLSAGWSPGDEVSAKMSRAVAGQMSQEELRGLLHRRMENSKSGPELFPFLAELEHKAPGAAAEFRRFVPAEDLQWFEAAILAGAASSHPEEALAKALAPGSSNPLGVTAVFQEWSRHDSDAARESLLAMDAAARPQKAIEAVAGDLARSDMAAALNFLNQVTAETRQAGDGCVAAIVRSAAESGGNSMENLFLLIPTQFKQTALNALASEGAHFDLATAVAIGLRETPEDKGFLESLGTSHPLTVLDYLESNHRLEDAASDMLASVTNSLNAEAAERAWALLPVDRRSQAAPGVAQALAQNRSLPEAVAWVYEHTSGEGSGPAIGEAFRQTVQGQSLDEALNVLDKLPSGLTDAAVEGIAQAWSVTEPNAAANWLLSRSLEPGSANKAFAPVWRRWMELDPDGMQSWLDTVPAEQLQGLTIPRPASPQN